MIAKFVGTLFALAFFGFCADGLAQGQLLPWQQEILDEHNALRSKCGVPPLVWSHEAAPGAQEWAQACKWGHTPQQGPDYFGENIAGGPVNAAEVVDRWYAEIKNYNFAAGPQPGIVTGHFTQVVWKDTRQLACGMKLCTGLLPGWGDTPATFWVCRYSPGGNYSGQYQQNVSEACPK